MQGRHSGGGDLTFWGGTRCPASLRLWAAVALALVVMPIAGQGPVDPPAQNPPSPAAPLPAVAPADPAALPPSREPLPAPEPPAEASAPAAGNTESAPVAAEPVAVTSAAEPGAAAIAEAPLQEVPEPLLPELPPFEHQLVAYRAAAKKQYQSALRHYEAALQGEPDNLRWGTQYRQVLIAANQYDRGLKFLERLAKEHPQAANLHLNLGYAYVDKVPVEGALSQAILAGAALREFGKALEIEESWLAYYSRGSSYVFWPPMFNRTLLGIADLERALELAKKERPRSYHALAWTALGDGFWRLGKREEMRRVWRQGLEFFPASSELAERLARPDAELDPYLLNLYRLGRRVDTRLEEIWQAMREEAP